MDGPAGISHSHQIADADNAAADESVPFIDKQSGGDSSDEGAAPPAVRDKLHLVYMITLLHGVGMLLPWNTFLTIGTDVRVVYEIVVKIFYNYDLHMYHKFFFRFF